MLQTKMEGMQANLPLALPATSQGAVPTNGEVEWLREEAARMRDKINQQNDEVATMLGRLDHFLRAMWEQEARSPPSFSLLTAYELQRFVLLTMYDLQIRSQIDGDTFYRI